MVTSASGTRSYGARTCTAGRSCFAAPETVSTTASGAADLTTAVAVLGGVVDVLAVGANGVHLYQPTKRTRTILGLAGMSIDFGDAKIQDGQGALVVLSDGIAGTFSGSFAAGSSAGSVNVSAAVRFNSSTEALDEIVDVEGTPVALHFGADETFGHPTAGKAFHQVSGSGTILIGGFIELTATFSGSTITGGTIFVGNGPSLLDDGSPNPDAKGVSLTGLTGTWDGTTLTADGTVTLVGIPGVTLTGTIHASGTKTGTDGQFTGTNLVLNVDGLALTGSFAVTKSGGNLTLTLTTVALDLGTGTTPPVHVSIPTGTITVSPAGVVADVTADVTLNIPGQTAQTLSGRIQLNTTGATALSLAPGTTRVLVTGNLSVAGQSLSGTFGFEQTLIPPAPGAAPGAAPTKEVRVFASGVGLTLGTTDGSDNLTSGVRLRNGAGALVLTASGMAGTFSGDVTILVPGAIVVGSVALALNTGTTAVNTTVDLGAGPVTINVPAGTATAAYLKFTGTGLALDLGGQKITADVTVEKGATAGTTTLSLANVGATFGDGTSPIVVLSGGNAAFTIAATGTYGVIAGHLTINIPSVTVTGTLVLALNTTSGSQSVTWTDPVTTKTNTVSVATGILFVGRDLHLLVGGTDLSIEELRLTQTSDATGAKTTTFGLTNASLALAGVGSVTVNGNLVASPAGVAGRLSLSTGLTFGSAASLTGTLALTTNSGAQGVTVGGVSIPAGPYLRIDGSGTLTVGDLSIAGAFTVERATSSTGDTRTVLGLTGGIVSLGGSQLVTGVQGALVVIPGATGGIAASLSGTVDLSSVLPSSVQVSGTFAVAINQTSARVSENVTVGSTVVVLDLVAGPYVSVSATGAVLTIAGQTLSGDLSFTRAMDGSTPRTVLALNHLALSLGGGAVTLSEGHGALVISGSGDAGTLAGKLTGTIAVTVPGVAVSGTVALEIYTAASGTATIPTLVLGTETLPGASVTAGLRVTVTNARLQVAGQRLDVDSVVFTQSGSAASRVVTVSVTNARLFLGTPGSVDADPSSGGTGLQVVLSNGELVMTTAGLAASFTGAITLVGITGIGFSSGPISLRLNTGTAPVTLPSTTVVPAGSFLRLELGTTATPLTLTVGDPATPFVTLSGAFAIQKAPTPGADGVLGTVDDGSGLQLAATEVSIFAGDPGTASGRTDDTGLWLDHGTVLLLLGGSGLAGHISASAALYLGDGPVASVASAVLDLNQRGTAVDEQISVGGTTQRLTLPKGPYLHVELVGAQVAFGGFSFSTDLSITKQNVTTTTSGTSTTAMTTTLSFAHLTLAIGPAGRPVVQVSNGHGDLVIGAGGVHGDIAVDLALLVPGVTLTGTFALSLDTRAATRGVTVSATGVTLGIGGQTLTGSFVVKQDGTTREVLLLPNLTLNLGDGTETFVSVGVSGPILLTPTGVALDVTATLTLGAALAARLGDKLSFGTSGLAVEILVNTTGAAVDRTGTLAGQALALHVPTGSSASPYVRVQTPTGQTTTITVMGQTVTGAFTFEQTGSGTARVVRIGLTNTEVHLGSGAGIDRVGVDVTGGSGALLITSGGVAGGFQGTIALTPALATQLGVSASGTVRVLVNTLATSSATTIGGNPVTLPAGPYLRVEVNNLAIAFGAVSETISGTAYREYQLSGSFLFQQASTTYTPAGGTATTGSVLTIAMAGLQLARRNTTTHVYDAVGVSGLSGVIEINPRGAGGWALSIAADISANVGPLKAGGRLVGTFSTAPVVLDDTVDVNGTSVRLASAAGTAAAPAIAIGLEDAKFDFGGIVEIQGNFTISGNGDFTATNLTVFIGKGPYGQPGAIGVAVTNASVHFHKFDATTYVLSVAGTVALVGLDGLRVSGTATLEVNTSTTDCSGSAPVACGGVGGIAAQTFSLLVSGLHLGVPGVLDIGGTLAVTRQPNGTLDLVIANADVLVAANGQGVIELKGYAGFSISPLTGFRLSGFKVSDFTLFPTTLPSTFTTGSTGAATGSTAAPVPTQFPVAHLASPLNGGITTAAAFLAGNDPACGGQACVVVTFTDPNKVGLNAATITDAAAEIELWSNGTKLTATLGTPVAVAGRVNTYAYRITGLATLAEGVVEVRFVAGSFADSSGTPNMAGTERFFVLATAQSKPGPIATLAGPSNGETLSAGDLNARRYIDVTYTSSDGSAIDKLSIEDAAAEFTLSGTGVLDVMRDATGAPVVVGVPLLIAGFGDTATTRTYRYFLKDANTANTTDLFGPGTVTLTFKDNSFCVAPCAVTTPFAGQNVRGLSQTFTLNPAAEGAKAAGGAIKLGPLSLQGPRIGLADVGFADGMLGADHQRRRGPCLARLRWELLGAPAERHQRHDDHGHDRHLDQPDHLRRHRRPARPAGHLRPQGRRPGSAERQREDRARWHVGHPDRLPGRPDRRRRAAAGRGRGVRLRPAPRPGDRPPGAAADRQRDHLLPEPGCHRHHPALRPRPGEERRRAHRRVRTALQPGPGPGGLRRRVQDRHRGAGLRPPAGTGRADGQPARLDAVAHRPRPEPLRHPQAQRPPRRGAGAQRHLRSVDHLQRRPLLRHRRRDAVPGQGVHRERHGQHRGHRRQPRRHAQHRGAAGPADLQRRPDRLLPARRRHPGRPARELRVAACHQRPSRHRRQRHHAARLLRLGRGHGQDRLARALR